MQYHIIHVGLGAFLGMQSSRIGLILKVEMGCISLYLVKVPFWEIDYILPLILPIIKILLGSKYQALKLYINLTVLCGKKNKKKKLKMLKFT